MWSVRQGNSSFMLTANYRWGWMSDWHGGKVLGLVVGCIVVVGIVERYPRRGFGCSSMGDINEQCLGNTLTAGIVGVESPTHFLLWTQCVVLAFLRVSRDNAESDIGSVKVAAQRICIFFQNHIPHIVDEVVFANLNQCSRGIGPLDPDLAVQHGGADVVRPLAKIISRRRANCSSVGGFGGEECLD